MNGARLLAALSLALLIPACGTPADKPTATSSTTQTSEAEVPGVNATDRAFADAVVAQQQAVKELTDLARTNSSNPALITLADTIAAGQQQDAETMRVLMVQWTAGEEAPDAPQDALEFFPPATVEVLGSLRGPEFDKLWLQAMISHHQGVAMMAGSEIRDGENVDAKTLAQTIIAARQAETVQLQQILGGG